MAAESIFDDDLLCRSRVDTLFHERTKLFILDGSSAEKSQAGAAWPGRCGRFPHRRVRIQRTAVQQGRGNIGCQICGRALNRPRHGCTRIRMKRLAPAVQIAEDDGHQPALPGRALGVSG